MDTEGCPQGWREHPGQSCGGLSTAKGNTFTEGGTGA